MSGKGWVTMIGSRRAVCRAGVVSVVATMAMGVAGCAQLPWRRGEGQHVVPLQVSSEIPSARGIVKLSNPSKDGNRAVELAVEHMAPPERVAQSASAYVVWLKPSQGEEAPPQNMGVLALNK